MSRPPDADPPTPDAFFEQVRSVNPFAVNRVVPASVPADDAPEVHRAAFDQLTDLAGRVRGQQVGVGAVVWGEAGIGKSHLLARLAGWAGADHARAVLVYVANLQAAPELLPRSLLRGVVSVLTRGRIARLHETILFRLVNAAVRHALGGGGRRPAWEAATAYGRLIDGLSDAAPTRAALVDRPAYDVLFRFFRSAHMGRMGPDDGVAGLAVRWLAGDALDPAEGRALGLRSGPRRGEAVALADDEHVKRVLITLAQLAWYGGRPFVLCFDQADNLEPTQFAALARFLHALLDGAANLLVVTAGVRTTLAAWEAEGVVQYSSWDRLAQHVVELQRVPVGDARPIVQARLRPFLEPFHGLDLVPRLMQTDDLFPLGESWAREFLAGKIEVRPRDVINWAREGWRRQQGALTRLGGPAWLEGWQARTLDATPLPEPTVDELRALIDEQVGRKLHEHRRRRVREPAILPPDAYNLAGLLHTLLRGCVDTSGCPDLLEVRRQPARRSGAPATYQLMLRHAGPDGRETSTGLLCLASADRFSMAVGLGRLYRDTRPPDRIVLVTDQRRPLDPARKGREYLTGLRRRPGGRFIEYVLPFEQYAELDALQGVVGLARSGDLEVELPGGRSRKVSPAEVLESHGRSGRYRAHPLLRLLLTTPPVPAGAAPLGAG